MSPDRARRRRIRQDKDRALLRRVALIQWRAEEAQDRAGLLQRAGYEVACHTDLDGQSVRALRRDPPDAFVIDLNRAPSHGMAIAIWLRQQKATRAVPVLFIKGDPAKTERVRKVIPDALYTEWKRVRGDLKRAMRAPLQNPVVPSTMAGYSGRPLPKKLGIRSGSAVMLLAAPHGFERPLGRLPAAVRLRKRAQGQADVIVLFAKSRADLQQRFPAAERALAPNGRLWIAWPKKASQVVSDLSQAAVRAFGLAAGLVDYRISAIDKVWSGLCFARRKARRRG